MLLQGTAKSHAETARKDLLDEEEHAKARAAAKKAKKQRQKARKQLAAVVPDAEPEAALGADLDADIADLQGGTDPWPLGLLLRSGFPLMSLCVYESIHCSIRQAFFGDSSHLTQKCTC